MGETTDRAYELGFRSLDEEVTDREMPVEGTIPEWLSGALVRNGPGKFEFGGKRVTHWFDGLAMVRRYGFVDGRVSYTNRFLHTVAYEDGVVLAPALDTDAGRSIILVFDAGT